MANPPERPRRDRRAERGGWRDRSLLRGGRLRTALGGQPLGTVTFLFSDIVGSTSEIQRRGDRRAREFFRRHDALIRRLASEYLGHVVRQDGDGFFVTFRSTRQALRCAIQIQRGLQEVYADLDARARVRIGMHVGETIEEGGDYYGTAVNLAARVRGEAGADQILVTELVRDLASGEPEFRYRFWAETELRGLVGRVRLYELLWREGEASTDEAAQPATTEEGAALRRYATALAAWTEATDLSEWRGRYAPLAARLVERHGILAGRVAGASVDLEECFERFPRLLVIGEPGGGKTTALLDRARRCAERLQRDESAPVPVFVALAAARAGQGLAELIREALLSYGLERSPEQINAWLTAGRLYVLLDGAGEVVDEALRDALLDEIGSIGRRFPFCRHVLTARVEPPAALGDIATAVVQPLRPRDVLQYLAQYLGEPDRAEALFERLGGRERAAWLRPDSLISLARTPLMLNVLIGLESAADQGGSGRPSRVRALEHYTRHLFRFDVLRSGRVPPDVREVLLADLAFLTGTERFTQPYVRLDVARAFRDTLALLHADGLSPPSVDAALALAEADRHYLLPLLPARDGAADALRWSNRAFQDYFAALALRSRFILGASERDAASLQAHLSDEGWYRWLEPVTMLAELLDEAGALALVESCLRAERWLLACRALAASVALSPRPPAAGAVLQRLVALLRRQTEDTEQGDRSPQDPLVVVMRALLDRPRDDAAAEASFAACVGGTVLAAELGLDVQGLLTLLSLGLSEAAVRGLAWVLGRAGREVLLLRARLARLCALPSPLDRDGENLARQAVMLALAGSPEVLLLGLCLRVQHLLAAEPGPAARVRDLVRETLAVQAPLARRLRLWRVAALLEDACLLAQSGDAFTRAAALAESLDLGRRRHRLEWLADVLGERLEHAGVAAEVDVALPSLAEIDAEARRLELLGLPSAALYGLGRIVVNVPEDGDDDAVLAVLGALWQDGVAEQDESFPLTPAVARPGRRELVVYPSDGDAVRLLLQRQPEQEIDHADGGIDWTALRARMSRVLDELAHHGGEPLVYVLTASGEAIALPDGATPIDFAYHIHTRLGHSCVGAEVNGETVPLSYRLRHGDQVRVQVEPERRLPPVEWLERPEFITTARARRAAQQAVDGARREEAIAYGRELVEAELQRAEVGGDALARLLAALGYQQAEKLYEAAGEGAVGRRELRHTLAVLAEQSEGREPAAEEWLPVTLPDDPGLHPRYARCCRPQPGDPLVGYRSGDTVAVHHARCPTPASGPHRPRVRVEWRLELEPDVALLRLEAREGRAPASELRRQAALAGVEVLDLAASRPVEGGVTTAMDCRGGEAQLKTLLGRLRRLPGVLSVELLATAPIQ